MQTIPKDDVVYAKRRKQSWSLEQDVRWCVVAIAECCGMGEVGVR